MSLTRKSCLHLLTLAAATSLLLSSTSSIAHAESLIGDLCRIKGQERNTLWGTGLVTGLKGTGDGKLELTARSLARIMHLMGAPVSADAKGNLISDDLQDAKNVALVTVMAYVPAQGARQGDELDCVVSGFNAKSLAGGILLPTPMLSLKRPTRPGDAKVYAYAQGPMRLEDPNHPTTAHVSRGCRLESDFLSPFVKDNTITLVLNQGHAGFPVAQDIEDLINRQPDFMEDQKKNARPIAQAIDQVNILVRIPDSYKDNPVLFASLLLRQRLYTVPTESRVVLNERTGAIAISANVEIAPFAVTHKNIVVDIGNGQLASQFVDIDPQGDATTPKLKSLINALNALRVPSSDVIEIIRELERGGAIHAHVIYEQ